MASLQCERENQDKLQRLTIFWIQIDLILENPLYLEFKDGQMTGEIACGAIMAFGVTENSEEAAKLIVKQTIQGDSRFAGLAYKLKYDYVGEIVDLQSEVYTDEEVALALVQDPQNLGLWYRTGAGWYNN